MRKVGIIGAMDVEVQTIVAAMTSSGGTGTAKKIESAKLSFYEGELNGINTVAVKSGVGKVNAALCAQRLILEFGVTHIINTGIAGAVAHGLGVFDVVVSTDAVYHDVDATCFGYKPGQIPQMDVYQFPADKPLAAAAEKAFAATGFAKKYKLVKGRVASGDQFVSSGEMKNRIREACDPACVEMEGAAIAHACWLNNVPFVIIRSMSDMADDGEEAASAFNEKTCAEESASIVLGMFAAADFLA
ncbi:MAG TPA: 5'-methylthioadenosine/adenosylhomocysteine nucleosidase [Treponema sp.]|nr:5'-methylthioadenosine/adenosylhomocysteine nucleosidase [Treponema sp.]